MGKRLIGILMFFVLLILAMAITTRSESETRYGEFVVYRGSSLLSFGVCASSVHFDKDWLNYTLPSGDKIKINLDSVIEVEAKPCSVTRAVN